MLDFLEAEAQETMALRCVADDGTNLEASAFDRDEWEALRAQARAKRHLHMPCCPARAVLKTSRLGTRFFAHKARGGCEWKPETPAHLHLKELTLLAAREAGWDATTEANGVTADGECWTADVLAVKDHFKVAVEIQWSGQTDEETLRRQERYRRSGIRGVWLLRQPGFPISHDLPAACIGGSVEEGLKILIPRWAGMSVHDRKEDRRWFQILDPESFMQALFERRFRFSVGPAPDLRLNIETGVIDCWKCRKQTRIVTWLAGKLGPHKIRHALDLADGIPGLAGIVQGAIRHRRDIGSVRERYSQTVEHSYVSNGCAHCGALIGRFFEHEAWYSENETVGSINLPINGDLRNVMEYETQTWGVWEAGT